METLFLAVVFITAIITVIIEIYLIVKFVELCNDVRKIKTNLLGEAISDIINAKTVRRAVITGKEDEVYEKIIRKLIDYLEDYYSQSFYEESCRNKIKAAEGLCGLMGRELPEQLQSLESFRAFYGYVPEKVTE